jgi:glucokinase-like ROK family protein
LDDSSGGRPATLLTLNPTGGQVIGIELGVDFISAILADFIGQIAWREIQEIDPSDSQETIISYVLILVDKARAVSQQTNIRMLGIGVTLPGMVDTEKGILLFSPNLQWHNIELQQIIYRHTGIPTFVENDANAAALGEHTFGVARQSRNFIFLSIGVGIGCGLFLNGDLYRGAGNIAGEIGHTRMDDSNRPCRCGKRGCWETSGNQYSLIERIRALLDIGRVSILNQFMAEQNSRLSMVMIAQAAEAGDEVTLEAINDTGNAIGLGVANLINIFNPEMVVIGGAMGLLSNYLLSPMIQTVQKHILNQMQQQSQVVLSQFGPTATVMGAVALVIRAIMTQPNRVERMA